MSSVNWQKLKGASEVKAKMRHNDKDLRKVGNHSNPHIDKSKTHLNLSLDGLKYSERCKRYDKRVKECKSHMKRVRSDAVTCIGLNIKLPGAIAESPYEIQKAWCEDCYRIVKEFVGEENIVSATADFDEIHKFYNPDTNQFETSRAEIDVKFVPAIDEKLNAKAWQTKGTMGALNRKIEDMTQKLYACCFMTGKGGKNVPTEVLKTQSAKAEAQLMLDAVNALKDDLEADREAFEEQKSKWAQERENELKMQNTQAEAIKEERRKLDSERAKFAQECKNLVAKIKDVTKERKKLDAEKEEFKAECEKLEAEKNAIKQKSLELDRRLQAVGLTEQVMGGRIRGPEKVRRGEESVPWNR